MKNKVKCKSCNTISEADQSLMGVIGGLGGGLGAGLIVWNKEIFGYHPSSFLFAIMSGIVLVFIAALIQNSFIKLSVAENQNDAAFKKEIS